MSKTGIEFDVSELTETQKRFQRMAQRAPQIADRVIGKWSQSVRAFLKSKGYPGRNRRAMRWVSEKQRKYVMAAIRRGEIKVPYSRTGKLPNSYFAKRVSMGVWAIGNSSPHGRYVVGDAEGKGQYWMHQNRWYKMVTQIKNKARELVGLMKEAFTRE
jgi:hypothetical protein